MLVLVPPSEGKAAGGCGAWRPGGGLFGRRLRTDRVEVATSLHDAVSDEDAARRLLDVGGDHLLQAIEDDQALLDGPAALQAVERYTGVVWSHLDQPSLGPDATGWIHDHVTVVSGLLGLVAATDPVPPYRLKMSAVLPELGKLSRWWRPRIDSLLAANPVVDLLPNEHADAAPARDDDWVSVRLERPDGRPAAHQGKAAKGLFLRHLATACPASLAEVIEAAASWQSQDTDVLVTDREIRLVLLG